MASIMINIIMINKKDGKIAFIIYIKLVISEFTQHQSHL